MMEQGTGYREPGWFKRAYDRLRGLNKKESEGVPDRTLEEKYADHQWCLEELKNAQDADHDRREKGREAAAFISAPNGMWEQEWYDRNDGRPRYSYDLTTPHIDQIDRTMKRHDFTLQVQPAGGEASKDTALTIDGLIRHIENVSNAKMVYRSSDKATVRSGQCGWEVVQDYVDGDTFDQDLLIRRVPNWLDTVWLGPHKEPDGSDAKYGWKLEGIPEEQYRSEYPDRSGASVSNDRTHHVFFHRQGQVVIGLFYYLLPIERDLVKMSDGNVYDAEELTQMVEGQQVSVLDELKEAGVTEVKRRKRTTHQLCIRKFDTAGWIDEKPKPTVFEYVTLVPEYGDFSYEEDKTVWRGAIEKMMDPQRGFNYVKSREVEEGALAPKPKIIATKKQMKGHESMWRRLNTSKDPVLFYNPDSEADGKPGRIGGAEINPGLRTLADDFRAIIDMVSGIFSANRGENAGFEQSGVAIQELKDSGDAGADKYIEAREIAQAHTGRILVKAIPKVYTPGRQIRILQEDGSAEFKQLGTIVTDSETGATVVLNELEQGSYEVTCTSGPSFQSRSSETATAIKEIGQFDETFITDNGDILANSVNSPGMKQVAERRRRELFLAGKIPEDQLTDEEKAQKRQQDLIDGVVPPETPEEAALVQWAQAQPRPEDPMMVAAQAEADKARAEMLKAETSQFEAVADREIEAFKAETDRFKTEIEAEKAGVQIEKTQADTLLTAVKTQGERIKNVSALVPMVAPQQQ